MRHRRKSLPAEQPRTAALLALVSASTAWTEGRWPTCIAAAREAEHIAETRCTGAWWEIGHARAVLQDALRWSGGYHDLARTHERCARDAAVRGDRFAQVTFQVRFGSTLALLRNDPEAARAACEVAAQWTTSGVHLQHLAAFHAVYLGLPEQALHHALGRFRQLRWSPLRTAAPPRAKLRHQLAVCRLALAAQREGAARRTLIAQARRDAAKVRGAGWRYTSLLADIAFRTADVLEGRAGASHADLRLRAERLAMPQLAAALELADAASPTRQGGARRLERLGAARPHRWARVLLPGMPLPEL
jgi:hypothetical protein